MELRVSGVPGGDLTGLDRPRMFGGGLLFGGGLFVVSLVSLSLGNVRGPILRSLAQT